MLLSPSSRQTFFKNFFFFRNHQRYRKKTTTYIGKFIVDLSSHIHLLVEHILISPTVCDIQGLGKSQKTPPPLILENYCPDCAAQGRLRIPSQNKHFKGILTTVKTFLEAHAHEYYFFSEQFLKNISKTHILEKRIGSKLKILNLHQQCSYCFLDIFVDF